MKKHTGEFVAVRILDDVSRELAATPPVVSLDGGCTATCEG